MVPDAPGSYQFRDADGRLLYVGKAKSLRHRVNSYFGNPDRLPDRTVQMLAAAETIEWIQVANELEALMLEFSLIQTHSPRFNVELKDGKSYPYLALTLNHEWPRAVVMRGKRRKGVRYFGPYGSAGAIRETLDLLLSIFPIRTCSDNKFKDHRRRGRPCLLYDIERCAGPCVGAVSRGDYDVIVSDVGRILSGEADEIQTQVESQMQAASNKLDFELAARCRDRLVSIRKVTERQQMVGPRSEAFDVFGVVVGDLEVAIQVFYVRKGRVIGRNGFVVDRPDDDSKEYLLEEIVAAHYRGDTAHGIPIQVLVPWVPQNSELLEEWLTRERSTRVVIRVPQRGRKRSLQVTVTENAKEGLAAHRLKRAFDYNTRARALKELREELKLAQAPLRIECYDMSHLQGGDYVGSMVVFEDGLPKKSDYRRFRIRESIGNDDYAAMREVLIRRFDAYLEETALPVDQRSGRFSYPPQLLLVDGGKGQLGVAEDVIRTMGLSDNIQIAALAKRFEEVFTPGDSKPVRFQRGSEALYLLQRIRDESHRVAVAYHRQLRSRRMTGSALDNIAGLGPVRRSRLIRELGGLSGVRRAALKDLKCLTWLPETVAISVFEKLHSATTKEEKESSRSAVVGSDAV